MNTHILVLRINGIKHGVHTTMESAVYQAKCLLQAMLYQTKMELGYTELEEIGTVENYTKGLENLAIGIPVNATVQGNVYTFSVNYEFLRCS